MCGCFTHDFMSAKAIANNKKNGPAGIYEFQNSRHRYCSTELQLICVPIKEENEKALKVSMEKT